MVFNFECKQMYPIFGFAKCCWSIHFNVVRLGKNAHSKQRKAIPTQTLQFHVNCRCPASLTSIQAQCIFSIYVLVWSNIRNNFGCRQGRKTDQNIQILRMLKKNNQQNLLKLFKLFFAFSNPSNFVAVRFVSLKKCTSNCTSVLLILLFTSRYIFQRKSKVCGILVGFIDFFKWAFQKKTGGFFVWVQSHQH